MIETVRSGVRQSSKTAEVMNWDWGWPADLCKQSDSETPPRYPLHMGVSEWSTPIDRGGIKTEIGEYSISVVGPGPRAKGIGAWPEKPASRTMAKTQFNNTWEISAVPVYSRATTDCPALHGSDAAPESADPMASWTFGGYPSPNLEVAKEFYFWPAAELGFEAIRKVARRRYGAQAARRRSGSVGPLQ